MKVDSYVLEAQIIPVIKSLAKRGRKDYSNICKEIAANIPIKYQTVKDKCTRYLNLNTNTFLDCVESGKIKAILKNKYPFHTDIINKEL